MEGVHSVGEAHGVETTDGVGEHPRVGIDAHEVGSRANQLPYVLASGCGLLGEELRDTGEIADECGSLVDGLLRG
ncbi:hypothetical protein [Streptomyces sp. NRRL S-1448]|uniref:hypothetical protein n=1 Tax=Streptomyces sp. NRRL S-1448 TaxID=1463883 RepID=UPI00131D6755|nr:hypothetical protein [Streptomyces sp. NRRL S-1448]